MKERQLFFPGMDPLDPVSHYNYDPIGEKLMLAGAGPLALITGDQLHPPMVDDEMMWSDGLRWKEGAIQHVRDAAMRCMLESGQKVLDVGCGIAGPSRILVDEFDIQVLGITISETQKQTADLINAMKEKWNTQIRTIVHDCQKPLAEKDFDCAWSMNMLYHVANKDSMLTQITAALHHEGKLMIDDWMLTPRATEQDRKKLGHLFVSPHFAMREELVRLIAKHRFCIQEFVDLGHVGRTWLSKYFAEQFDRCFRKRIEDNDPVWGKETANHFVDAVQFTIDLYHEEKLTYCQLVATRQ